MYCANPDFETVESNSNNNVFCMGAIGEIYKKMGGNVIIKGKPDVSIYTETTNQINLEKKTCLMIGPGLVDFLNFQTLKNNEVKLEIQNCLDPLFLIPLLYRSIQKNIYSKISNQNKTLTILGKNEIFIHDDIKNNNCPNFSLYLSKSEFQITDKQDFSTYDILNQNLSYGLNPHQSSWDKISALAFRTYVPESETSREKGAGGGDAND